MLRVRLWSRWHLEVVADAALSTHIPRLWQDFISNTSKCVCVCVLLFLWVLHCGLCACVCVASAAIFHPFWSPLRTCGTLCECVCLCRCMHMYSWLHLCLCVCVCVCTSTLAPSIYSLSWRTARVCVLNVWWNFTRTEARTHAMPHTHTVCLIN